MATCFISHATEDRAYVLDKIVPVVRALGLQTWVAEEHINTAEYWEREILQALKVCEWVLLIMTPNSAASEWVKHELSWAMRNNPLRIIPILCRDCRFDEFHLGLERIQSIDFRDSSPRAIAGLVKKLVDAEYRPIGRVRTIEGFWRGQCIQESGIQELKEFNIQVTLKLQGQAVVGTADLSFPNSPHTPSQHLDMFGEGHYENFLQLNYRSRDTSMLQFGTFIVELLPNGREMRGRYVGFGPISRSIITGVGQMARVNDPTAVTG